MRVLCIAHAACNQDTGRKVKSPVTGGEVYNVIEEVIEKVRGKWIWYYSLVELGPEYFIERRCFVPYSDIQSELATIPQRKI